MQTVCKDAVLTVINGEYHKELADGRDGSVELT